MAAGGMSTAIDTPKAEAPGLARLLKHAEDLIPVFRERAAEGETLRRVPDQTIEDLIPTGLLRTCQPARFGGSELDWRDLCELSLVMARGDCSQAWVANIYAEHAYLVAMFPDEAQQDVWGSNPDARIAASVVPVQNPIERVSDGWRLTGRWSFASGIFHADWVAVANVIETQDDEPDYLNFLIPASDYVIDDDWHTMGMAGTGSATVVLDNLFVPDHRTVANSAVVAGATPGIAINKAPLYRMPFRGFAQLALAAVPVGTALGMVDDFEANLGAGPGSEINRAQFSEAAVETHAASLLLLDRAKQNMDLLSAGAALGETEAALTTRDSAYAMVLIKRAATRLYEMGGGRAQYRSSSLQRGFRDVQTGASHGSMNWPRSALRYAASVKAGE
jgi:3-hydroxy-9,10-secoandrosta-1,3,5(10)-triene-9,17-dione monooxygenase